MNWVIFWVLFGFFIGNMVGLALFHYFHKKEQPLDGTKGAKIEFGIFTALMFLIGSAYLLMVPIKLLKKK